MSEPAHNGWNVQPLGKIAEPRRGITYSSEMLESTDGGLPYINMKSFLKGGGFNAEGTKRYAGIYTQNDLVGKRDLLLANTDVTAGDIVGAPALLPHEFAGQEVLYSHHVTRLRINGEITVPFLYHLLCLPEYRSHMLRIRQRHHGADAGYARDQANTNPSTESGSCAGPHRRNPVDAGRHNRANGSADREASANQGCADARSVHPRRHLRRPSPREACPKRRVCTTNLFSAGFRRIGRLSRSARFFRGESNAESPASL